MISFIRKFIYVIKMEKNWFNRTSDAPRAFKVTKNV